jgi:hypothetical protein
VFAHFRSTSFFRSNTPPSRGKSVLNIPFLDAGVPASRETRRIYGISAGGRRIYYIKSVNGGGTDTRLERRRTSRLLLGPPSGSNGSSYTRMGASPCRIADSKKSTPSSAGVLGVFAIVGDEPADEGGDACLFLWMIRVG